VNHDDDRRAPRVSIPPVQPAGSKRIDLHCHTSASTEADEAVLIALKCPESYSDPAQVYDQAKRRGMDFVTVTDHDTLAGVTTLLDRADVLSGEELTCYFPEDRCKIHLLLWGHDRQQHQDLQQLSEDIYEVARYVEENRLAHSVAHPVYRQNDVLEKWHLERLILLFKGFECLNGAHSVLHRESFEPMIDRLTPADLDRMALAHGISARWPEPWVKARTGGSDDHGLFNIGRTWTEFPPDVTTIDAVLDAIRAGRCSPGGEAGNSLKLAHNFYSVAVRYYSREMMKPTAKPTMGAMMLQALVGERPRVRKRDVIRTVVKNKVSRLFSLRRRRKQKPAVGTSLLFDLFASKAPGRFTEKPELGNAMRSGFAPLGEHGSFWDVVGTLNRDIAEGLFDAVSKSVGRGEIFSLFDTLSAVAAHQFMLSPYYFALFHQNRERHLLRRITGHGRTPTTDNMRVGVFTDTFDEINGVSRFVQDMSRQAGVLGRSVVVHTCSATPDATKDFPYRKNFTPLVSRPMPFYPDLQFVVPPLVEILEWADRQQFDAIHVDTPGPMGLCGIMVARMLRIPLLSTYHTDFPAYVKNFTKDHRLTCTTESYMRWFYGQTNVVFSRSREYQPSMNNLGITDDKFKITHPAIDTEKFSPKSRDPELWTNLGVVEPVRLLYVGRVSTEKNLPLLVEAFKKLHETRKHVALVVAGDGPYMARMKAELRGLPAYFLGFQNDQQLAPLYAGSDLFVFPSRTDTLGQVVIEAQASGLPVLVSDTGGPKEVMGDGITGMVLPAVDPAVWALAIDDLLNDEPRRQRMARTAPGRMVRYSLEVTFEAFWADHLEQATRALEDERPEHAKTAPKAPRPVPVPA